MESNEKDLELAHQLTQEINDALNRQIEEHFRAALLSVDSTLNMDTISVVSNVENDNELTVDGVDDETIDKAMAIFTQQTAQS